jgi:hypothetical protein
VVQLICVARFLFDHFVGAQQNGLWHRQSKRLGGLEVDDELELGRLHDGQVRGLGALEDLTGVETDVMKSVRDVRRRGIVLACLRWLRYGCAPKRIIR